MLCHCVTQANQARYASQLEDMFKVRHSVFVDRMGWHELRRADDRDIDEYDTDDSVYLLVLDDDGVLAASTRMNPSWRRHQLEEGSELNKRFAMTQPPRGPTIWEGSRLVPGLRHVHGKDYAQAAFGVLMAGLQEFCTMRGITTCIGILETRAHAIMASTGLEIQPLGLPVSYDTDNGRGEGSAMSFQTGVRYLIRARQAFGIRGPVLFEAPPVVDDADTFNIPLVARAAALRSAEAQAHAMRALSTIRDSELQDVEQPRRLAS